MSVDINNLGAGGVRDRQLSESAESDARAAEKAKSTDSRGATAHPTDVQLSEDARSLARLADDSGEVVFDEGRVDAIRQAISEGRYHVDPERLAQKILDLEVDLNQ